MADTKTVRVRAPKTDFTDQVIAKIKAKRPRKAGDVDFEVTRSSQEILSRVRYVLRTGIECYDGAIGIGGLPFGRITEIYGTDGSAKTAMAIRAAVKIQEREIFERVADADGRIQLKKVAPDVPVFTLYIDNEQAIDEDGKTVIDGTELDVAIGRCDTIDQMFNMMETAIDGMDSAMVEVNKDLEPEDQIQCFVGMICDTLAGTSSREEMSAAWDKQDYPRQAQQLRQGFRTLVRKFNRRNVLGIFTNQVGDKFEKAFTQGGMKSMIPQEADFNVFGGRACKFFASLRIFHAQANAQYKLDKSHQFPDGRTIQFTVAKNRMGKPWRTGRMVLLYDGGLSNVMSILETLLHMKLAEYGDKDAGETGIKLRFQDANIDPVSFPAPTKGRKKTPTFEGPLAAWPAFFSEHEADLGRLWNYALDLMQRTEDVAAKSGLQDASETESSGDREDEGA